MILNIAAGMTYLASRSVVHRDLGARNLLVSKADGKFVVKVADLGISRLIKENEYVSTQSQFPVKWSPPEVIRYFQFSSKSDVWSFGVAMWEIFEAGTVPYPGMTNKETTEFVLGGGRMIKPKACPPEVYEIMRKCWEEKPENRPSFKNIFDSMKEIIKQMLGSEKKVEDSFVAVAVDFYETVEHPKVTEDVYNNSSNVEKKPLTKKPTHETIYNT